MTPAGEPLFDEMSREYAASQGKTEETTLDVELEFGTIRPGDVLVIRVSSEISADTANKLRHRLIEAMPRLSDVIVVPALGIDVYRDE